MEDVNNFNQNKTLRQLDLMLNFLSKKHKENVIYDDMLLLDEFRRLRDNNLLEDYLGDCSDVKNDTVG